VFLVDVSPSEMRSTMETVADNNATVRYIKPIQIQDLIKASDDKKVKLNMGWGK